MFANVTRGLRILFIIQPKVLLLVWVQLCLLLVGLHSLCYILIIFLYYLQHVEPENICSTNQFLIIRIVDLNSSYVFSTSLISPIEKVPILKSKKVLIKGHINHPCLYMKCGVTYIKKWNCRFIMQLSIFSNNLLQFFFLNWLINSCSSILCFLTCFSIISLSPLLI